MPRNLKIAIGFLIFILFVSYFLFRLNSPKPQKLKVGQATLNIEIADTPEKRAQGLSDRKSLCADCGLLFIFDAPNIYPFWMRRMNFDIDILWIKDGEVVDITYGAKMPPKEELESPKTFYESKVPVDMVLEVNAGWVKKKGVKMGNKINLAR